MASLSFSKTAGIIVVCCFGGRTNDKSTEKIAGRLRTLKAAQVENKEELRSLSPR
jgi:hypothetical protein